MNLSNRSTMIAALALIAATTIATLSFTATATRSSNGVELGNMGSVDVFALIDRALSTDAMSGQREQFEIDSNAQMEETQQQMMAIQQQAEALQDNDPQLQNLVNSYQQLNSILQGQTQRASQAYQELIANQIATAYTEIYKATNEVAATEGIDFVFATRSTSELLQTDTITGVTQEILARPLLTPPTAVDLTEMIRVKLGYPEQAAEDLGGEPEANVEGEAQPATQAEEIEPEAVESEPTAEPTEDE